MHYLWRLKAILSSCSSDDMHLCNTEIVINSVSIQQGYMSHKLCGVLNKTILYFISDKFKRYQNIHKQKAEKKRKLWCLYFNEHFYSVTEGNRVSCIMQLIMTILSVNCQQLKMKEWYHGNSIKISDFKKWPLLSDQCGSSTKWHS